MKATIEESKIKKIEYPCLMESDDVIILFTEPEVGTVLKADDYNIGYVGKDWKMCNFIKFEGILKLENE